MSRHRDYRIECDGQRDGGECLGYDAEGLPDAIQMCETRKEAESAARQFGWLLGRSGDRCPECRKPGGDR